MNDSFYQLRNFSLIKTSFISQWLIQYLFYHLLTRLLDSSLYLIVSLHPFLTSICPRCSCYKEKTRHHSCIGLVKFQIILHQSCISLVTSAAVCSLQSSSKEASNAIIRLKVTCIILPLTPRSRLLSPLKPKYFPLAAARLQEKKKNQPPTLSTALLLTILHPFERSTYIPLVCCLV